jgi:hypothetical protein
MGPRGKPSTPSETGAPTTAQAARSSPSPGAGRPQGTPYRTEPLPEDNANEGTVSGFDQADPELITGVKEYDDDTGAGAWELARHIKRFFIGASRRSEAGDISIPGRGLSATHAMLERRARGIRLYDEHSANGTWVKDAPITTADLRPGDRFTVKPVTLVAMNDAMRLNRPALVEIVGTGWVPSPDWLMVESYNSSHLVIAGERGCEQEDLARAIHAISPRRAQAILEIDPIPNDRADQIAIVKRAANQTPKQRTTVVLTLQDGQPPLDHTFLSMLYSTAYGVRVIVLSRTSEDARRALGEALAGVCHHIALRPLAYRAAEIDQLLDRAFERRKSALRAADLTTENQEALRAYLWPRNLAELRLIAAALIAHETLGGWRRASDALAQKKSTLQDHFNRIGLQLTSEKFFNRYRREPVDR